MKSEALTVEVGVVPRVYRDLTLQLKACGDRRHPDEVVNEAIKAWLAANGPDADRHGYQWKDLYIPNGTELRLRWQGEYYYAHIVEDALLYAGEALSPRAWALMVTGTVRNAWCDIWLRRSVYEAWSRADTWRAKGAGATRYGSVNRRRRVRRSDDGQPG